MNKPKSYSWVIATLAIAVLAGIALTPTYPGAQAASQQASTPAKKPAASQVQVSSASMSDNDSDLKERVKTLEEKERQTYTLLLEDQRKKIDWWFAYLAVFTAVAGIGGALIPFLMGRKDKEAIQADKDAIQADKKTIEQLRSETQEIADRIRNHGSEVAADVETIKEHKATLLRYSSTPTDAPLSPTEKTSIQEAAKEVEASKESTFAEQLRARAINADLDEDYEKARHYWAALTQELPDDAQAWMSLGFALQKLAGTPPKLAIDLLKSAGLAYEKALLLEPQSNWAANNWGNALSDEAITVAYTDLPAARLLWQQAYERYARALAIKPDMHDAASNWGCALYDEAAAVANTDLPTARLLWHQAYDRYAQALTIKPDKHDAANNWGVALSKEAIAIANCDLAAARLLWLQAYDRYAQALAIKPDKHEAANNWSNSLLREYQAIKETEPDRAVNLLAMAEEKCHLAEKLHPGLGAYNIACIAALRGKTQDCIFWLEADHQSESPQTAAHIRIDPDLTLVRPTPEFKAWWEKTFGPDEPLVAEASAAPLPPV